jgi:hypothetical protein
MRWLIGGLAALAIGLTGCGSNATPTAVTTTQTVVSVTTSVPPHGGITDQDRVFLAKISEDKYFANVKRDPLFSGAHLSCDLSRAGQKTEALTSLLDTGMEIEHATNLFMAASMAYCPDQLVGVQ